MASISGTFSAPAVTSSVSYTAGGAITVTVDGEWQRAWIVLETSTDGGTTWTPWPFGDLAIGPGSRAPYGGFPYAGYGSPTPPVRPLGTLTTRPTTAGLCRLNCREFNSGHCEWTLSA